MSRNYRNPDRADQYAHNYSDDHSANRARGYGDFDYPRTNGYAQDRSWDQSRSRSRSRPGRGRHVEGNRRLDEVLTDIQQNWDFMAGDNCVPIHIALRLLDPSSLGLASRYDDFNYTYQALQNALKAIVNEHHQGFNSSIGTFHKIQTSLNSSQHRIHLLKDSLVNAKSNLSMTKPEVNSLAATSQSYDEMLQILNSIEQLQLVPDKLEKQISDKKFLSAVDTLQEAMRSIRRSDVEAINALSDLSAYFTNQEHYLVDILVEELHNHLYLKSPYCEDRFKIYTKFYIHSESTKTSVGPADHSRRQLYEFIEKLGSSSVIDDTHNNPESDTFAYIQFTIEALHRLGRLDVAVEKIEERLPTELFKIVEKAINDVNQKSERVVQNNLRVTQNQISDKESVMLSDLLDVLYGRFEAIAESHRAVHEVIYKITEAEGINSNKSLLAGFRGLWELYQSEIRSLMHDYLATEGSTAYRTGQNKKNKDLIRDRRDRTKRMFALADINEKAIDIKVETENLQSILKSSVPGLVTGLRQSYDDKGIFNSSVQDGSATGHKILVEPSIFNMGTLLPPSLEFLSRLKGIVPTNSDIATSTLTSFLDDFLVNVFQPQLEETMADLCNQVFTEADSFHQDPHWNQNSRKPILRGTRRFFELMLLFCKMLDNLPHDQALSQLMVIQMVTYYEKCLAWYKSIITRPLMSDDDKPRLKMAALVAENEHLKKNILLLNNDPATLTKELLLKETSVLLESMSRPLELSDLIKNRKSISLLCMLLTSLKWLAVKSRELRHISTRTMEASSQETSRKPFKRQWSLVTESYNDTEDNTVYLPLNSETAITFDNIVSKYTELANTIGYLLRMEIRCRIFYGVTQAFSGSYHLGHFIKEPDSTTMDLYQDLLTLDDDITQNLLPNQQKFLMLGTSKFLDQAIITKSLKIKTMNSHGCDKMLLNITVLQQSMRNIDPTCSLPKSIRYFECFKAGPDEVLKAAQNSDGHDYIFSYDELKSLLELSFSESLNSEKREMVAQAQRQLDEKSLQLSEYMWNY